MTLTGWTFFGEHWQSLWSALAEVGDRSGHISFFGMPVFCACYRFWRRCGMQLSTSPEDFAPEST